MKKIGFAVLALGMVLLLGCAKETTGPEQEPPQLPPKLEANVTEVPADTPDQVRPYGQMLGSFRNSFTEIYQRWRTLIQSTQVKREDGKWVWEQTHNTFTVRLVAWVEDDGTQKWELYFNGVDPQTETPYNNVKILEASLSRDGKAGTFKVFDPVTQTLRFTYSWTVEQDGTIRATLTTGENQRLDIVNNPDGSGELVVYIDGVKRLEASWNADGSGSWASYDENGQQTGSGSWGAGGTVPPDISASLDNAVVTIPSNTPSQVQFFGAPYVSFHNLFTSLHGFMRVVMHQGSMTHQDSLWTWEMNQGNLSIRLEVTMKPDSTTQWALYIDGTDAAGNQYENWKAMEGQISADRKSGVFTLYEQNSTNILNTYEWTVDADGSVSAVLNTSDGYRVEVQKNADGSGSLKFYKNNLLQFEVTWNADHSGSWKVYDENGNIVNQGSWS